MTMTPRQPIDEKEEVAKPKTYLISGAATAPLANNGNGSEANPIGDTVTLGGAQSSVGPQNGEVRGKPQDDESNFWLPVILAILTCFMCIAALLALLSYISAKESEEDNEELLPSKNGGAGQYQLVTQTSTQTAAFGQNPTQVKTVSQDTNAQKVTADPKTYEDSFTAKESFVQKNDIQYNQTSDQQYYQDNNSSAGYAQAGTSDGNYINPDQNYYSQYGYYDESGNFVYYDQNYNQGYQQAGVTEIEMQNHNTQENYQQPITTDYNYVTNNAGQGTHLENSYNNAQGSQTYNNQHNERRATISQAPQAIRKDQTEMAFDESSELYHAKYGNSGYNPWPQIFENVRTALKERDRQRQKQQQTTSQDDTYDYRRNENQYYAAAVDTLDSGTYQQEVEAIQQGLNKNLAKGIILRRIEAIFTNTPYTNGSNINLVAFWGSSEGVYQWQGYGSLSNIVWEFQGLDGYLANVDDLNYLELYIFDGQDFTNQEMKLGEVVLNVQQVLSGALRSEILLKNGELVGELSFNITEA
eukprot:TRINITY_DN3550_c0_g2_i5.p1 TRINITY_DN3550_c0_g2~~TRINITY_DN3550_c0_g2_i5.p1  ORF type:complete len:528 (+),score=59.72 TRINITY_DN3550_c0_g2_i5:280-1863(+)